MDIQKTIEQIDLLYSQQKVDEVEMLILEHLPKTPVPQEIYPTILLLNELLGIYREKGDEHKAIQHSEQVLALYKDYNLPQDENYATTILNVATVYRVFGKYDLSEQYYNNCIEIYNEKIDKNDYRFASLYNNLSLLYTQKQQDRQDRPVRPVREVPAPQKTQDYDKAIQYLKKSIEILHKNENTQVQVATANTSLAQIYMNINDLDLAKKHIDISLDLFDEFDDYHHSASLATAGDIANFDKDFALAIQLYKNSMSVIEKYIGRTQNYFLVKEKLTQVEKSLPVKGLQLCREFYNDFGVPMLVDKFPKYVDKIAVGLVGHGSECFGFDDDFSHDHDFGAGFCLWLTDEVFDDIGEQLQLEYDKLPTTYKGVTKVTVRAVTSCGQFGDRRVGVFKINNFYKSILNNDIPTTNKEWLEIDEVSLAQATNGEVFKDDLGEFTKIRDDLTKHYPNSVLTQKIVDTAHLVSQTGQYNFARAVGRKDFVTARMILSEFISNTIDLVFLLNREYTPFYKWKYRKLKELPNLFNVARLIEKIESLSINDNEILILIEKIVFKLINELKLQGFIKNLKEDLFLDDYVRDIMNERLVNDMGKEEKIKLVEKIVAYEWEAFDKVQGIDGRATCQDDYNTFNIMRSSQYMAWNIELIESFIADFEKALSQNRNLISEKYACMMKSTDYDNYKEFEHLLPKISREQARLIEDIIKKQLNLMIELKPKYPNLVQNARVLRTSEDTLNDTSYETYLRGELYTYSLKTTKLYSDLINYDIENGVNTVKLYITNTAILYGFDDIDSAEASFNS